MEKQEFKQVLFKVAFCAMTCDGEIHKREIEELKLINKNTSFFSEIDLSDELNQLIDDLKKKGAKLIEELFDYLHNSKLNTIQELIILEVALRIINSDLKHDENEMKFIHLLRSKLELHDETINDRFGELDILHTYEFSKNIMPDKADPELDENIEFPKMSKLMQIDLDVIKPK
jgi:hypothetical protein